MRRLWQWLKCLSGRHVKAGWGREHCKHCGIILDWEGIR
jgi:hypothetical protein